MPESAAAASRAGAGETSSAGVEVDAELQFTPARELPPKRSTWELAESGMRNAGFERHEATEYVIKARHGAGDDVTVEQALRLALAQIPVCSVREELERYGPS